MKSILLFGGSFDPVHNAHIILASRARIQLNIDKCYFIIAKNPRWKSPSVDAKHRLKMLKLALKGQKNLKVSLIEYKSKEENRTYDTIKALRNYEKVKYYYLIGSDQLDLLHKWYKIDELSKMVQFVVFKRFDYPINEENLKAYNCKLLEGEEYDISSTKLRYLTSLNTPKVVLDYIAKNNLYYMHTLKTYLSIERLQHSLSVASLAYELALNNNVDPYKAYLAGLIHDIAKSTDEESTRKIMESDFKEYANIGKWVNHQFVGAKIASSTFKITDEEILDAIMYHATGNDNMTALGKIIYCADKLDPTRGWDSRQLITYCLKDINAGFNQVLKDNIAYFKKNNINYKNELTLKCIKRYLGEEI